MQIPLNRFASMDYVYNNFGPQLILGVNNQYNALLNLNKKVDVNISNGIIDFIAKFGLPGLFFLFYSYLKYCYGFVRRKELLFYCFLIFFVIGFGEPVLHLPLFLIFLFLPYGGLGGERKKGEREGFTQRSKRFEAEGREGFASLNGFHTEAQ
jgi:hypothetical protein